MVHSNGTRSESHRFKIDFTGKTKYSGRSADLLVVSAGGEAAARRAMPTSRAWARLVGSAAEFRTGLLEWFGGRSVATGVVRSEILPRTPPTAPTRSEEHTSELQSRGHLVCRLP